MCVKTIALRIAIVIPRQRRKVTRKRAKSKLVWDFAASASKLFNGTVEKNASKRVWVNLFTHKASESNFNRVKSNARPLVCRLLCKAVQTQCGNYIFLKLPHVVRSAAPCKQTKAWSGEQVPDRGLALCDASKGHLWRFFPCAEFFGTFCRTESTG